MNKLDKKIWDEEVKYKNYLYDNGLNLTSARKVVFDEVIEAHGHFAVEELIQQCKNHKP